MYSLTSQDTNNARRRRGRRRREGDEKEKERAKGKWKKEHGSGHTCKAPLKSLPTLLYPAPDPSPLPSKKFVYLLL
jgi:hypothetical protein